MSGQWVLPTFSPMSHPSLEESPLKQPYSILKALQWFKSMPQLTSYTTAALDLDPLNSTKGSFYNDTVIKHEHTQKSREINF